MLTQNGTTIVVSVAEKQLLSFQKYIKYIVRSSQKHTLATPIVFVDVFMGEKQKNGFN